MKDKKHGPRAKAHSLDLPAQPWIAPALLGAYFVFAYLLLAAGHGDYLRQWESMSLFLPTGMYFGQCMELPGGLLEWAATYLVQFFYHPWLGAAIYAALSALLAWTIAKAFGMSRAWAPAAVAPSAMLLLAFLSQGYFIYTLRGPGMPYTNLLGALVAAASVLACKHLHKPVLRMLLMLALVIVGYPLFGFYGLLAGGLCALAEVGRIEKRTALYSLTAIALTLTAIGTWPLLYHRYAITAVMPRHIYTSALPILEEGEFKIIVPYIIAYALMGVGAVAGAFKLLKANARVWLLYSILAYAAALSSVLLFKYSDKNFDMTVSLSMALMDEDWARAKAIADDNQDFDPTRLNVLFTDIALMRQGMAGDLMFSYRTGSAPYKSIRATSMRDGGVMLLSYHFGRINNAYRWAMEYHVEYGSKVAYLKIMAKSALLMGEYDLARKYLRTLAQTMNHKAWAEKYLAYADNPDLIAQDPELGQIKQLMKYRDFIGGDAGKVESYLLPMLSSITGGTVEMLELSLQTNLMQKQLDEFMMRLQGGWPRARRLPKHYQEAAVLWSYLNRQSLPADLHIDPAIAQRLNAFNELAGRAVSNGQGKNAELFRPSFGDTYWFYFFLVNDMKTM